MVGAGCLFYPPYFALLFIATAQLTMIQADNEQNLSSVSGFYGPGATLGWLMIAINTIYISANRESETKKSKIDLASSIATGSYPLVAAFDTFLRYRSRTHDPQYYAAVAITHWGLNITTVLSSLEDESRLIWLSLWSICLITVILDTISLIVQMYCIWKLIWLVAFGVFNILWLANAEITKPSLLVFFLYGLGLTLCGYRPWDNGGGFNTTREDGFSMVFAFPTSSASLLDLDQATAFALGLLPLVLTFVPLPWVSLRRLFKRLRFWRHSGSHEELDRLELDSNV